MALTVASAFTTFSSNIRLTDLQRETVWKRRDLVAHRLEGAFLVPNNLSVRETKLIGSAGRQTMIRPPDDIDLLAIFYGEDFEPYRHDSQKFLYRVRDVLDEGGATVVGARGQAVRIFYTSGPRVDVAPVFPRTGGYLLPAGDGSWISTDPDAHADYSSRRNNDLDGYLKPFVRMLKGWNRTHSTRLKSFHLEAMVGEMFASMGGNYRRASEIFFGAAGRYLHVQDPAGHAGDLSGSFTSAHQETVLQSFHSAYGRVQRAVAAEAEGRHAEALRLWRIVYGSQFPAHG